MHIQVACNSSCHQPQLLFQPLLCLLPTVRSVQVSVKGMGPANKCRVVMQGDVLQVWNPADSEEEVLVMVCRTGLNTTMGGMIRGLLAPIKAYREKEPFIQVLHVVSQHYLHSVAAGCAAKWNMHELFLGFAFWACNTSVNRTSSSRLCAVACMHL